MGLTIRGRGAGAMGRMYWSYHCLWMECKKTGEISLRTPCRMGSYSWGRGMLLSYYFIAIDSSVFPLHYISSLYIFPSFSTVLTNLMAGKGHSPCPLLCTSHRTDTVTIPLSLSFSWPRWSDPSLLLNPVAACLHHQLSISLCVISKYPGHTFNKNVQRFHDPEQTKSWSVWIRFGSVTWIEESHLKNVQPGCHLY